MAGFWDILKGITGGGVFSKSARKSAGEFLTGTPEKRENVSTLRPEQEGLYNQLIAASQGPGAGGAIGQSADYYRNLLSDNPADLEAYSKPMMRQYNEEIVPGLSEQFAGMGSGGLSSSGFRNAQVQGGVDLAERIGQIRANLRQAGAAGLANISQQGLGNYSQNQVTQPGSEGFLSQVAPAIGTAAGAYLGGPAGAAAGYQAGSSFGKSSPYGKAPVSSAQTAMQTGMRG